MAKVQEKEIKWPDMAIRGERFHVDLSSDDEDVGRPEGPPGSGAGLSFGLIGDIKERSHSTAPHPPAAPDGRTSATGFPPHKERSKMSAFKQQRGASGETPPTGKHGRNAAQMTVPSRSLDHEPPRAAAATGSSGHSSNIDDVERRRIGEENNQRLAQMSDAEIESERQELMAALSPSLIQRMLNRANMDDPQDETARQESTEQIREMRGDSSTSKKVSFQSIGSPATVSSKEPQRRLSSPGAASQTPPAHLQATSRPFEQRSTAHVLAQPSIHFPKPAAPPDLDPSDPSFLTNLHQKYFPTLPVDPSKLAWMSPIPSENSAADQDSPYFPLQESLPPSSIRFDFRGDILPPRTARAISGTKGLHHHGEAPEAAGYTIPELARLARSRFPAQRCVAFQTLGRILYKLGKCLFGDEGSELVMGLWRCVEEGKVLETVQGGANADGGHVSAKAYATEAVWFWQKGGGRRWKAA
ncbi:hypothetical protein MMC16_003321 [Acarospora aff. strigata]|nr:hypothetical protein [Acarospora aff. strigata]